MKVIESRTAIWPLLRHKRVHGWLIFLQILGYVFPWTCFVMFWGMTTMESIKQSNRTSTPQYAIWNSKQRRLMQNHKYTLTTPLSRVGVPKCDHLSKTFQKHPRQASNKPTANQTNKHTKTFPSSPKIFRCPTKTKKQNKPTPSPPALPLLQTDLMHFVFSLVLCQAFLLQLQLRVSHLLANLLPKTAGDSWGFGWAERHLGVEGCFSPQSQEVFSLLVYFCVESTDFGIF